MASEIGNDSLYSYKRVHDTFWMEVLLWTFIYGPDTSSSLLLKSNLVELFVLLVSSITFVTLKLYGVLIYICRKWNSFLAGIEHAIWIIIREPWVLIMGRRYGFFKWLLLSVYYSVIFGPRFLIIFIRELHVSLALQVNWDGPAEGDAVSAVSAVAAVPAVPARRPDPGPVSHGVVGAHPARRPGLPRRRRRARRTVCKCTIL